MEATFDNETENEFTLSEISADAYLKCALCGQGLKFVQQIDYLSLTVKEEAHCMCCKVKLKARDYIIQ